jgi:hypothetical protein
VDSVGLGLWLQIDISQAGAELRATARGSQGEEPHAHTLGPQSASRLIALFSQWVKEAASRAVPLTSPLQAQELYQALFQRGLQDTLSQLRGSAQGQPILLRLNPVNLGLYDVPWGRSAGRRRRWTSWALRRSRERPATAFTRTSGSGTPLPR